MILKCIYNPDKNLISNHLDCLNHVSDKFSKNYDNAIFLEDSNTCIIDNAMASFYSSNDLASLIDQPTTCYRNPDNLIYTNLIFTKYPDYFQ